MPDPANNDAAQVREQEIMDEFYEREAEIDHLSAAREIARALVAAEAALLAAQQELAALRDEHEHLKSEWSYGHARGDSLIYAWEREGFDEWQRGGRDRAERAEATNTRLRARLARRIESDDSMEDGFCDCVWCVEDRDLLAPDAEQENA